jgi:hypothetical protein
MSKSESSNATETSLTQDFIYAARYYLGGQRSLILLTVAALGAGAALNWGWLVAMGVAPLLLVFAPCAVMCALGHRMSKAKGKSLSPEAETSERSQPHAAADPSVRVGSKHREPLPKPPDKRRS